MSHSLPFGPATLAWFEASFGIETPVQRLGWEAIAAGRHALLLAPTGSGKTLAGFLWSIDRCLHEPKPLLKGVRVLYVSPLKALAHDVERNLRTPLRGITKTAESLGIAHHEPTVAVRTGDTSQSERRQHLKDPPDIMVTTPESLYLMLGSKVRETLRTVTTVIIDEVHALAPTKRGLHLALSLERLSALAHRDPQRIGLSATARPVDLVAGYLGGDRSVCIIDTTEPPLLDVTISVAAEDMENPPALIASAEEGPTVRIRSRATTTSHPKLGIWPSIHQRLIEEIDRHRTTIVFVNSRGLCERLAQQINDLDRARRDPDEDNPTTLVLTHHGSLSQDKRKETEELLKTGRVRALVATSSLELGIDMASVDHVVMVESPGTVARGLQRIGRAGHQVSEVSRGTILPKHRGDLLESAVVLHGMRHAAIEPLSLPERALDVLSQQIVAMVATESTPLSTIATCVRRAFGYRDLSDDLLHGVLDMLSGRYPSTDFAELRPRLHWDRTTDELEARPGSKHLALTNGGTIPDRGLFAVHLGEGGPRVGELDEEMVNESRPGEVIALGASSWRILEITRDRVFVQPAPGEGGRLPFWHGDGPGRPLDLGRALGAFLRTIGTLDDVAAEEWLHSEYRLDALAASNLLRYVREQEAATRALPTDRNIVIERFRDELGDHRICILTPFGSRVHAPWAMAIQATLARQTTVEVQSLYTDDGIVLRFADGESTVDRQTLLPNLEDVEGLIVDQLAASSLFATQFRENAARSLLLPRRRPGQRTPLWAQRLRSQSLLAVAREFPSFPIILETYRSCLRDVFDVPALTTLLRDIASKKIAVTDVETASPSPFARSLVFAFTAQYLYREDLPAAERRAHALSLDRSLLRELLGHEDLRQLLDPEVMAELETELQRQRDPWRARDANGLHDLLRQLGDLSLPEVTARCVADPRPWLEQLVKARRVFILSVLDEERFAAIEDAALLRDALDITLPDGIPDVFREPRAAPLKELLRRHGRRHAPFTQKDVTARYGLPTETVARALDQLVDDEVLLRGGFRPSGCDVEYVEKDVFRQLKQRTLARLRNQVAPVTPVTFARFLISWHGIDAPGTGPARLEESLTQLEGVPLLVSELETAILPARVPRFRVGWLDELFATGAFVWVGDAPLGASDGRVVLYRRETITLLRSPPTLPESLDTRQLGVIDVLRRKGACFTSELSLSLAQESERHLEQALWELVWAGIVTNDTLQPLRARGQSNGPKKNSRRRVRTPTAGGRWSLVERLFGPDSTETERRHARATSLLARHGIFGRQCLGIESPSSGFSLLYPVLRAMEEAGKIRRGYFVEGLGGAQFAPPGAVDRLRTESSNVDDATVWLAASDPANPYGASLPWPPQREGIESAEDPLVTQSVSTKRVAGARVVIHEGELCFYLSAGARQLYAYPCTASMKVAVSAAKTLLVALKHGGPRLPRIRLVNGKPAQQSPLVPVFREAGFQLDFDALMPAP